MKFHVQNGFPPTDSIEAIVKIRNVILNGIIRTSCSITCYVCFPRQLPKLWEISTLSLGKKKNNFSNADK